MPAKKMFAHCNTCGGDRNHHILKQVVKDESEEIDECFKISWNNTYYMLECCGCEKAHLLHTSWCSEATDERGDLIIDKTYYPPSIFRPIPKWFYQLNKSWHITKLVKEIYLSIQNNALSLASMGIRAAIEAIMIDKVKDSGTFNKNLNKFKEEGYISTFQLKDLEAALELGHASIHRGFMPKKEQIEFALDILESLLHGLYVLDKTAKETISTIPKRNKA